MMGVFSEPDRRSGLLSSGLRKSEVLCGYIDRSRVYLVRCFFTQLEKQRNSFWQVL